MRIWTLFILIGSIDIALAHRFSLQAVHKLWMKHSESDRHDVGLLANLRIVPRFFFSPRQDSSIKQVVVVPESDDYHSPNMRISRMMGALDVERLAREWPESVTPGGPGPEWW